MLATCRAVFCRWALLAIGILPIVDAGLYADTMAAQRQQLVAAIRDDVQRTRSYIGRSELLPTVMRAIATVPREHFVPPGQQFRAYENRPLPIGYGQTISQPYIVALMTDLLAPERNDVMLEVGTGSGYQAAILAQLVDKVYTIEIIPELATPAKIRLQQLEYQNVETRTGDGYFGWPEAAPFDGIIVTAAADHVPPPLIEQLKPNGRMVIPVGDRFTVQELLLIRKDAQGVIHVQHILPVRFVPLTGDHELE